MKHSSALSYTFLIMLVPVATRGLILLRARRSYPRDVATAAASLVAGAPPVIGLTGQRSDRARPRADALRGPNRHQMEAQGRCSALHLRAMTPRYREVLS